jgi:FkbM family methyltransferase
MYLGIFEPSETILFKELLAQGDTFIDIGAHIGWYTTIGSKLVGNGNVVAFEPYKTNALTLKENLTLNNCTNVLVLEVALGDQEGTLALASSDGDSGSVTALPWAHDGRSQVPLVALDEVIVDVDIRSAALIKIDVEGWEAHVIRGGERTVSGAKRVLVEINRPALEKAGSSQEEIFDLLRGAGFTNFLHVVEGGLRRFTSKEVSNVLATRSTDRIGINSRKAWVMGRRSTSHLRLNQRPCGL